MRSVSGLRGIVGADLVPEVVARYAGAFGAFVTSRGGRTVGLARDSRQSGPAFVAAASEGLRAAGVEVTAGSAEEAARDQRESQRFYCELLGFRLSDRIVADGDEIDVA